jgi:4-hydroxyphenylpyruvate dioxygenase
VPCVGSSAIGIVTSTGEAALSGRTASRGFDVPTRTVPLENPMGTDGFEFIEFGTSDGAQLGAILAQLGFGAVARHRSKDVVLYRQGDINIVVNDDPASLAQEFAPERPGISALAFRVTDATAAYALASDYVACEETSRAGAMELNIPAIMGVGDTSIYLVDRYGERSIYDVDFLDIAGAAPHPRGAGLASVDHLAYSLGPDELRGWADSFRDVFNFRESPPWRDRPTAANRRDLISPCGKIRLRLTELSDVHAATDEAVVARTGERARRVGLSTPNMHASVEFMRERGVEFIAADAGDEDAQRRRAAVHRLPFETLRGMGIVIDDLPGKPETHFMRIRTRPLLGSLAFELVQRLPR